MNKKCKTAIIKSTTKMYLLKHKQATSREIAEYLTKNKILSTKSYGASQYEVAYVLDTAKYKDNKLFKKLGKKQNKTIWGLNK